MFLITSSLFMAIKINVYKEFRQVTQNFSCLNLQSLDTRKDQGIPIGYV